MLYKLKRPTDADLRAWATRLRGVAPGDERRRLAGLAALPAAWRTRNRLTSPEWPGLDDLDLWRSVGASHAFQLLGSSFSTLPLDGQPPPYQVAYATGYLTTMQGHIMPEQTQDRTNLVAIEAVTLDLTPQTLGGYLVTGDVTKLSTGDRAHVIVALHRLYGLSPLSKAFIIVEGSIYPTAAAAGAVRRKDKLGVEVIWTGVVEVGGVKLIKAIAECGPKAVICARRRDRSQGVLEHELDGDEDVTRTDTFVPWQVDRWTDVKGVKAWQDPSPDNLANAMMKLGTKAGRRATFSHAGLGSSSAEDLPADSPRDWLEAGVDDPPAIEEAPHADEAGG